MSAQILPSTLTPVILQQVTINEKGPVYVGIAGRYPGLMARLLTAMGLNPVTLLVVHADRIQFEQCSIFGRVSETIPIKNLSNVGFGFVKDKGLFYSAVFMGSVWCILNFLKSQCGMDIPYFYPMLAGVGCGAFLVGFFLRKEMIFFAIASSGYGVVLPFRKNVVEGKDLSREEMTRIENIMMNLIQSSKKDEPPCS